MTKRLFLFFISMLFAFYANAQKEENTGTLSTSETVELIQRDIIDFENPIINDVIQLQQIGNNNELTAIQQLDGLTT